MKIMTYSVVRTIEIPDYIIDASNLLVKGGNKIGAIKFIRLWAKDHGHQEFGLSEAKDVVERQFEQFGGRY